LLEFNLLELRKALKCLPEKLCEASAATLQSEGVEGAGGTGGEVKATCVKIH